nr:hypothetical protein [Catenulispora pinisilvae]
MIPPDFTASVGALARTQATVRPTITVLTNPGLGSLGSSLASQISQAAAHQASLAIGKQLTAAVPRADPTTHLLLADPVAVTTQVGHAIGQYSGLGLTAFYYTLLPIPAGFVGGNLINSGVDTALGYADSELGPWRRPPDRGVSADPRRSHHPRRKARPGPYPRQGRGQELITRRPVRRS